MKRGTQIALVGFVLLALAALSSVKRGAAPKDAATTWRLLPADAIA